VLEPTAAQDVKSDITYTAKFVCGSISDSMGPLRPGHYDTSIGILNKKSYEIGVTWSAVSNDGDSSNTVFRNLGSEKAFGINCKNIKELLGTDAANIIEGFVVVRVPISSLRGFDNEQIILDSNDINILDVQVFYTANALGTLPREVAYEKIAFYIIQDGTGKIPKSSFRKLLDVSIPSIPNELTDTEQKVKSIVASKFDLDENDLDKIRIRIKSVSIGVGAMLDDHAVSLHVVTPYRTS
jgi:hypothetical protein